MHPLVTIKNDDGSLKLAPNDESAAADAMSGTMRALLANMVKGVSTGFEPQVESGGRGLRAQATGQKLNLQIGFSHPVVKDMPAGIKVECPTQTEIVIKGADRQVVGQIAAEVRAIRPPEPYKGKAFAIPTSVSRSRNEEEGKEPSHVEQEGSAHRRSRQTARALPCKVSPV